MVSTASTATARLNADGLFLLGKVENLDGELARGNRNLIWGWKRNVGAEWRAVYFGGDLGGVGDEVALLRWYLFYRHVAERAAIAEIAGQFRAASGLRRFVRSLRVRGIDSTRSDLRFELGKPSAIDLDRVRRLQLRRPRRRFPDVVMPEPRPLERLSELLPADIYVGSGLSYESGLPTLCDMHLAFGVDNIECTRFAVGCEDPLPALLVSNLGRAIAGFSQVHVMALSAKPSFAMQEIARLQRHGSLKRIFTDNVDNLLAKVGANFERTRGSGVFNERYPATFDSDRLIVIGVAADRRTLVRQARIAGLEIITVNPCARVAPMVRHLDYIRPADHFYQTTAEDFFRRLASECSTHRRSLGVDMLHVVA